MSYNRVSSHGSFRGFRLNPRKFYVLRLRKRFTLFLRLFESWKLSYGGEALKLLIKKVFCRKGTTSSTGFKRNNSNNSSSSRRSLVNREEEIFKGQADWKMVGSYYGRSNSFYAEAIADCLEFIKRTSISSKDQIQDPIINHVQDRNS